MLYGFTYVLEITDLLQEWETYFHVTIYFKIHSLKFTKIYLFTFITILCQRKNFPRSLFLLHLVFY